jgi:hypothetical protein
VADSSSIFLQATRLFSFRVDAAEKQRPGPLPGQLGGYSEYALSGTVLRVYKGALVERDGQAFSARPLVYAGPIRSRPMGLWVGLSDSDAPHAGEVSVAACVGTASGAVSAGALLGGLGKDCQLLPASAAGDIERAMAMESSHASVSRAIAALRQAQASEPVYFLEYLFARYDQELRALDDAGPLLTMLGDPDVPRNLRLALVDRLDWVWSTRRALSPRQRDAYLLALVRAALVCRDSGDQANLLANQVKDWLQGELKPPPKASVVFGKAPGDRKQALALVRKLPKTSDLEVVERWLAARD